MSTDLHTLSGAYAIDALSAAEAEEFREHLAMCQACRDEVSELREAASLMGASEALIVPAYLKARVMAAVDQEPQLPPRTARTADLSGEYGGASDDASATVINLDSRRRWLPRLLTAAAAVVLIAVAGVVGINAMHDDQPDVMAAPVAKVFSAPDAHRTTVKTSNGGTLSVATSPQLGRMAVDTENLKRLGDAKVYQIWAVKDGTMISQGVVADLDAGAAMDMPPVGVNVAITVEPAGGSPQPTTQPIVALDPNSV